MQKDSVQHEFFNLFGSSMVASNYQIRNCSPMGIRLIERLAKIVFDFIHLRQIAYMFFLETSTAILRHCSKIRARLAKLVISQIYLYFIKFVWRLLNSIFSDPLKVELLFLSDTI